MKDMRYKEWIDRNSDASTILKLLIELEDMFIDFDEYQMENNQCYPEIEDLMLLIGAVREKYTNFVNNNLEVLDITLDN